MRSRLSGFHVTVCGDSQQHCIQRKLEPKLLAGVLGQAFPGPFRLGQQVIRDGERNISKHHWPFSMVTPSSLESAVQRHHASTEIEIVDSIEAGATQHGSQLGL